MSKLTRRLLLQVATGAAVSRGLGTQVNASEPTPQKGGPDVPGALYTGSKIELYTNSLSVALGDQLTIHVSTTARHFNLQIARVGIDEAVVWTQDNVQGTFHPTPKDAWKKGCRWPASVRLAVPAAWKSGYYQIKAITADEGTPSATFFGFVAVRASRPASKILLVLATNTYGAYNSYGGASFYMKESTGRSTGLSGSTGEHKVSFQRPWMPGFLSKPESYRFSVEVGDLKDVDFSDHRWVNKKSGIPLVSNFAGFHNWERDMVCWLERNGYQVDYAISSDLDFHPELLAHYGLMLSVGHDEYWSWGMGDSVESFVSQGGNVCFFSGNVSFWQVRYEDRGNSMVCYKDDYQEDPYLKAGKQQMTATAWSNHVIARPETRMTGLSTLYGGYAHFAGVPQGLGGYLVYRPEHWVFKDTGIAYGDCLGQTSNIVNFEVDGCPIRMEDGLPYPASDFDGPSSLEILGMVPAAQPSYMRLSEWARAIFGDSNPRAVAQISGNHNLAVMSIYTNNGTVFCAGTTDWTSGLKGQDPAIEQVTKNLLNRLSA